MATEVKAPVLPESVADGTIATWHKKVGDAVEIRTVRGVGYRLES